MLEYPGQFSDHELVKQHLDVRQARELYQKQAELEQVNRALADLERQSFQHLDLLQRSVLGE